MFKKRGREERLEKEGVRAPGVVVEARQSSHFARQGNLGVESDTDVRVHLRVRVEPEGEPPFEVETGLWMPLTQMLSPGSHVTVLYDPTDHGRFSILPRSGQEAAAAAVESFEQRSGMDPNQLFGGAGGLAGIMDQAMKNPHGAADAVRAALEIPPGMAPGGAQGPDRVDQLTKLAKLRDDGALTEAEFEAEKRRLLGGS
jgi:hypothetical protein